MSPPCSARLPRRDRHAPRNLEYLEEVGDPATGQADRSDRDNLKAAIASETHEYTDVYPGMARVARQEGFDEIADWFETLAKAGKSHAGRFRKALEENWNHNRRETWTQRLTRKRASARLCTDHECWHEVEQGLVAESAEPQDSPPELASVRSHGEGLQLRGGVQGARPQGSEKRSHRVYDRQPRLVAGGFRPLRRAS